jgi:hypothetical protein
MKLYAFRFEFVECAAANPGARTETKATSRMRGYGAADAAAAQAESLTSLPHGNLRLRIVAAAPRRSLHRIFVMHILLHVCVGKAVVLFAFFTLAKNLRS